MLALLDASEAHHVVLRDLYDENPDGWILPWAILPGVDYLVGAHLTSQPCQSPGHRGSCQGTTESVA